MTGPGGLLDIAPVGAAEYAGIEDRCRAVLDTEQTLFIFQGEATVALEAVARGLGRPGCRALNLVSGPYGATFGRWLAESGARVDTLEVPFDRAVTPDLLASALDRVGRVDVVSLVHAEAATGVVNDLAAIAQMAKSIGALVVVDAVASVGAEPLDMDAWGLDLVVLSAQKALAGPSGASIVVTSPGAWEALGRHPSPWRRSVLSLLDWRDLWVFTDRLTLPGIPNHLETRPLAPPPTGSPTRAFGPSWPGTRRRPPPPAPAWARSACVHGFKTTASRPPSSPWCGRPRTDPKCW